MINLKNFLIISFLVLFIDLVWIASFMKKEYTDLIFNIQKSSMNVRIIPAILTYIIIVLSILLFTIPNIKSETRLINSLYYGGLIGLFSYGMFSMTNYALIKNWSLKVAIMDTLWGFVLFSLVSYIGSLLII